MTNRKRIAIVGNAPMKKDSFVFNLFSKRKEQNPGNLIDKCDWVIRMNNASFWYKGAGRNTNILALVNRGNPAIGFALKPSKNLRKCAKRASEIWFTRPNLENDGLLMNALGIDQFKSDQSRRIIDQLGLQKKIIKYISCKDYLDLVFMLNKKNKVQFEPSTGICSLQMALQAPHFRDYEYHLFGFTWEGWEGHNWDLEKQKCYELKQKGVLFF